VAWGSVENFCCLVLGDREGKKEGRKEGKWKMEKEVPVHIMIPNLSLESRFFFFFTSPSERSSQVSPVSL